MTNPLEDENGSSILLINPPIAMNFLYKFTFREAFSLNLIPSWHAGGIHPVSSLRRAFSAKQGS
jgi:hypothetical protein